MLSLIKSRKKEQGSKAGSSKRKGGEGRGPRSEGGPLQHNDQQHQLSQQNSYEDSDYGTLTVAPIDTSLIALQHRSDQLQHQVWSLPSFEVSRQILMNDLNQVSPPGLLMTSSTALAN